MTRPIQLYQDCDQTITVSMNTNIQTATEIELTIDCPVKISKTLSSAQISSVSATGFNVAIDAADTADTPVGEYKMQGRATLSGKKYNIKITPDKIKVMDSVFVDSPGERVSGDYGR